MALTDSSYSISQASPELVFLIGFMAAGKTTIGKAAARKAGWHFQDLDDFIESHMEQPIPAIFEAWGEARFREIEQLCLRDAVEKLARPLLLSCGGGTPCYGNNMEWMNSRGITIYLQPDFDILLGRLRTMRADRPMLSKIPEGELASHIKQLLIKRESYYLQAQHILRGETLNREHLVNILKGTGEAFHS